MFGFLKKKDKVDRRWAFGALVAYIVMLVINGLGGSTTILGGVDTATVSDSYLNLFAPAGLTFSIWGLIYLLLGLFFFRAFEIWRTKKPGVTNAVLNRVLALFTLSSLINTAWMLAWQYNVIWLSVILMAGLLATLIAINRELAHKAYGWKEYALTRLPFSVYFGWITVATIANVSTWLVSMGWKGEPWSEGTWMVAVLIVGAILGTVTAVRQRDWAYLAVFVWAYAGILFKHLSENGFDGAYPSTLATLYILMPLLIGGTIALALRWPYGKQSRAILK